jgi:biopolymer transport protein ExbB/TolQ
MNDFSTVATFFKEGGIFMYFMLAAAVVVIAISVERFIVIGRAGALNSRKMVEDLVAQVNRRDITAARKLSRMSDAPAARVAAAMLQVADADVARLHAAADDAATLALSPLSRRLPHLNVLANVATLLGLLGTISGLITAFSAVGAADPAQRSAFMAAGISTALNATAFGLIIAIPTLIIQGYLVGMVERIAEQADEMSIRLAHALVEGASGHAATQVLPMHAQRATGGAPATFAAPRSGMAAQGGGQ